MKKTICLYFQLHQPVLLRRYHFFDIGKRGDYFDEYVNRSTIRHLAEQCYLPANRLMLELIERYDGRFKVSYSISGLALEQFERHAPDVIASFQALAATGQVEFLAETYAHSLSSLSPTDEFERQVTRHAERVEELFGRRPVTFRNSSLIYSDEIGERVHDLGYRTILTDGAKHVLGWKSPDFIYSGATRPDLSLLLKNSRLCDDITLRFSDTAWSEYPLTADKYARWILDEVRDHDIINLFMNYETFGEDQPVSTGILEFMRHLPAHLLQDDAIEFLTPAGAAGKHQPVAPLHVPYPISWTDEERDVTSWLGNELQTNAFEELYRLQPRVRQLDDPLLTETYCRLQASNHFYYMSTKLISDDDFFNHRSPYASPYDAFINYMNVLSEFIIRVNNQ
jgi:alpha-amylase